MRIDKLLSHAGFGTRKTVKDLLKKKIVQVDGEVVRKGDFQVNPDDNEVMVNGNPVQYERFVYLMLHKPGGVVSATSDDKDKTVIDLMPRIYGHYELFPVGRLDKDTEGLLLLTNDGPLNHALTSPKKNIIKTYYAKIKGQVTNSEVARFKKGITLDGGYQTKAADLRILSSGDISEIELDISEGKFHQVKRMFQAVDMTVTYLKRLRVGNIILDEQLPLGQMRPLNQKEMTYIQIIKHNGGG